MKKIIRYVLSLLCLCALLAACSRNIPSKEDIEGHFQDNYNDIQIVIDFMINTNYGSIYIDETNGTMRADLEKVNITDDNVKRAVKNLLGGFLKQDGQYYSISMHNNTIEFHQWSGSQDIGCGIAYSINGTDIPDIEYCTELVPLSETGWYYYVDDYNTWRNKTGDGLREPYCSTGDGSVC